MIKKEVHVHLPSGIISSPRRRLDLFRAIPANNQGAALLHMPRKIRRDILGKLTDREVILFLHYHDPDEITDLLQCVDTKQRRRLIKKLEGDLKEKVEYLLKFNPNTAAGLMSVDYIEVDMHGSFKDVMRMIRKHERRTGRFPTLLVVEKGYLLGELPGHKLVLHGGREKIKRHVSRIPHIKFDAKEEEVIGMFQKHPHNKVVVLDEDESIMGVIYSDDVLALIGQKPAESLSDFAGISEEEDVHDSWHAKVRHRYRWLILNLFTAFIAASVVGLFEETISKFVLLAVYMPIVAGMGGNTGTQAMAVTVRGIALREVDLATGRRAILSEMLAGGANGLINGTIVALVATVLNQSPLLGLVLGISMIATLFIAGFFGALMPLVLKRLGKDPASSASIFITTGTDICGFFVFLGLATLVL